METSFYYEKGVFTDKQLEDIEFYLLRAHRKQIEYLGNGLWSMRLGIKPRAIFTLKEENGKDYPHFLQYLPNHDYSNCPFLNDSRVLKNYQKRANYNKMLFDNNKQKVEEEILNAALLNAKKKGAKPKPVTCYPNKFFLLDHNQKRVLGEKLPFLLNGVAGSGKSLIALKAIENYINNLSPEPHPRILYICKSEALVKEHKAYWKSLKTAFNKRYTVDFMSIEFLIEEGLKKGLTKTDDQFFQDFCSTYFNYENKYVNTENPILLNYKQLREQFLICSGYDEEGYLELGTKQCSIDKKQRPFIYAAYKKYLIHLEANKKIDPDFYALDLDDYDLITVDEAQDLSHYLVDCIHKKAKKDNILYLMDSHQRLNSSESIRPYISSKIGNKPDQHASLVRTYRCPIKVVDAANKVLAFKQHMTDGLGDKYETPNIESVSSDKGTGSVYVCDEQSLLALPWMAKAKQANFVVITSKKNCDNPETLEALKKRFNTDLVLSAEQAKGLEYEVVLAYELYDDAVFELLKEKAESLDQESKPSVHQPKRKDEAKKDCITFFNGIYTSYTRAKTTLIICEKETRNNKVFLDGIKKDANEGLPPEDLFEKESTPEEWEQAVLIQSRKGNTTLAKNLFFNKLIQNKDTKSQEEQEEEYRAFIRQQDAKEAQKLQPPQQPKGLKPANYQFFEEKKSPRLDAETTEEALAETEAEPVAITEEEVDAKSKAKSKKKKKQGDKPLVIHTPVVPAEKKTIGQEVLIQGFESKLFGNFDEKPLMVLVKKLKQEISLINIKNNNVSLLDYIGSNEEYRKLFLKSIVNNTVLLMNIDFTLPPKKKLNDFDKKLILLKEIQKFLRTLLVTQLPDMSLGHLLLNDRKEKRKVGRKVRSDIHLTYLEYIIEMGLDIHSTKPGKEEPFNLLHYATHLSDVDALRSLHNKGVDLSAPEYDHNGMGIAHLAAQQNEKKIFELLKELKYDEVLNTANSKGLTPLHILAMENSEDIFDVFKEYKESKAIDLDPPGKPLDIRPSHLAASMGNLAVLKKMKELGIPLDKPDINGKTPLLSSLLSSQYGDNQYGDNMEVMEFLIATCGFTDPNVYLTETESEYGYPERLKNQISYLLRTKNLRPAFSQDRDGMSKIPLNIVQYANANCPQTVVDYLQGLLLEKYTVQAEKKEEDNASWTHYFSILEPIPEVPQHLKDAKYFQTNRKNFVLNMKRLLSPQTFNEACLMALWGNKDYKAESLNWIILEGKDNTTVSLMDKLAADEVLIEKFITCLVNNSYLLSQVQFEIPVGVSASVDEKLKKLHKLQVWIRSKGTFTAENLHETELPIHLLMNEFCSTSGENPELEALFDDFIYLGVNTSVPNMLGQQLIYKAMLEKKRNLVDYLFPIVDLSLESKGNTLAHLAALDGDLTTLQKIRDNPTWMYLLFKRTIGGETVATILLSQGNSDHFKEVFNLEFFSREFFKKYPQLQIDTPNNKQKTPCYSALILDDETVLKRLGELGADLSFRTPMNCRDVRALEHPNYLKTLEHFNKLNPQINLMCIYPTLTEYAELQNFTKTFNYLKELNPKSDPAKTDLKLYPGIEDIRQVWFAAFRGDLSFLELLDHHGVDLSKTDDRGNNFAHFAFQNADASTEIFLWLNTHKKYRDLLDQANKDGDTPFDICENRNRKDIATHSQKNISLKEVKEESPTQGNEDQQEKDEGATYRFFGGSANHSTPNSEQTKESKNEFAAGMQGS